LLQLAVPGRGTTSAPEWRRPEQALQQVGLGRATTSALPGADHTVRVLDAPRPTGDCFVIAPSGPLSGAVRAGGAKNSVLKLLAACLLAEGRHVLHNVPRIVDVDIMADMLGPWGSRCTGLRTSAGSWWSTPRRGCGRRRPTSWWTRCVRPSSSSGPCWPAVAEPASPCPVVTTSARGRSTCTSRASLPWAPPSTPSTAPSKVSCTAAGRARRPRGARLRGGRIVLEYPSHTVTDNLLMAAVLAEGTTVIENAAREPEVVDLACYLQAMGARITGAGTSRLEVEGVAALCPAEHHVVPDRVVAATLIAAVGLAGGDIEITDARPEHMDMLLRKVQDMGVEVTLTSSGVRVRGKGRLHSVDVATLPYPVSPPTTSRSWSPC